MEIPTTAAQIQETNFKAEGIKKKERALAALSMLAKSGDPVALEMLREAINQSFDGKRLEEALRILEKAATIPAFERTT